MKYVIDGLSKRHDHIDSEISYNKSRLKVIENDLDATREEIERLKEEKTQISMAINWLTPTGSFRDKAAPYPSSEEQS